MDGSAPRTTLSDDGLNIYTHHENQFYHGCYSKLQKTSVCTKVYKNINTRKLSTLIKKFGNSRTIVKYFYSVEQVTEKCLENEQRNHKQGILRVIGNENSVSHQAQALLCDTTRKILEGKGIIQETCTSCFSLRLSKKEIIISDHVSTV